MGKQAPRHEWRGTLVLGPIALAVRAFPAFGKESMAPVLYQVHRDPCKSPAAAHAATGSKKKGSGDKTKSPVADEPRGRVLAQPICARCGKELNPDEISLEVTMPKGQTVQLEPGDLDAMSFDTSKRVEAQLCPADDPTIAAIGFDRRLYLFPEPASVEAYWELFAALQKTRLIGFIPFIALKSDRAYVSVVRPLVIPPELFGEESGEGKPRKVLVLDCLGDTDKLKDPSGFPSYPGEIEVTRLQVARVVTAIEQYEVIGVNPEACVNPRTARTLRGVRRARRRALAR